MSRITRRRFVTGAAIAPLAAQHLALSKMVAAPGERYDIVVAGAGHNVDLERPDELARLVADFFSTPGR